MRIVFAGTPAFADIQLRALLKTNHEVVAVYTQPDKPAGRGQQLSISPVKALALTHHLAVEQPTTLKTPEALRTLDQYQPDLMIVAAYGLLLPLSVLSLPRYGCINVHASLLPRWRGASPIQQAILAGDAFTGITLMQLVEELDAGDILAQELCPISNEETAGTLQARLAQLGANLLIEKLPAMPITGQKQNSAEVTYAPKIKKEQALIDWQANAIDIQRKIRAFNPWPIAYTFMEDQLLRLWQAKVVTLSKKETPGKILEHTHRGVIIAAGMDAILLENAQLAGKKVLPFLEILKGHHERFAVGKTFG